MTKMGRPTTDPKTFETRIRMSDNDRRMMDYCAKQLGVTKSDVIRQSIRLLYDHLQMKE